MSEQVPLRLQGTPREAAWLRNRGYDGIYQPGECACLVDDMYPCGERHSDCRPGWRELCDEHCDHPGSGAPGDWHITSKPRSPSPLGGQEPR